jgi:hypothetical protein
MTRGPLACRLPLTTCCCTVLYCTVLYCHHRTDWINETQVGLKLEEVKAAFEQIEDMAIEDE